MFHKPTRIEKSLFNHSFIHQKYNTLLDRQWMNASETPPPPPPPPYQTVSLALCSSCVWRTEEGRGATMLISWSQKATNCLWVTKKATSWNENWHWTEKKLWKSINYIDLEYHTKTNFKTIFTHSQLQGINYYIIQGTVVFEILWFKIAWFLPHLW